MVSLQAQEQTALPFEFLHLKSKSHKCLMTVPVIRAHKKLYCFVKAISSSFRARIAGFWAREKGLTQVW